jgi:pyruvate carboxylase
MKQLTRMLRSLKEYYIMGIKTSIDFLKKIMEVPDFINGKYDTHFIEHHIMMLFSGPARNVKRSGRPGDDSGLYGTS